MSGRITIDGRPINSAADILDALAADLTGRVTPSDTELSKVNQPEPSVTSAREKTRERVARHRAAKRQAAAVEFVRTDASLYLHPDRLSQKAGAPKYLLRRMALKELVDNGLDAAPSVALTAADDDTFIVQDDGPGIEPDRAVALFSVVRPMMSTKLVRRPTRGAIGNGLRVATGAAFASGGGLVVESHGVRQTLTFDRTSGETVVADRADSDVKHGTRITITFGPALPRDRMARAWGLQAINLAGPSASPMLTHPDWYSEAGFAELVGAARGSAADLASLFGVDLGNASSAASKLAQLSEAERYIDPAGPAGDLTLAVLRALAPKAPKLLPIPEQAFDGSHRIERITAIVDGASVPAIVQVWAIERGNTGSRAEASLYVNRTPVVADLNVVIGTNAYMHGCGLQYSGLGSVPKGTYSVVVAITTPAIALISDGKTPDLLPFASALAPALGAVLRRAHRPASRGMSIKDAAFDVMEEAYLKASANNTLPANARQIMYAARPGIMELTGTAKLDDAYFTQNLLPAFMEEYPDLTASWDVVYDARGHLVEPHTGHPVPLGTIQVREYLQRRPRRDDAQLISTAAGLHPTTGPGDRYGAVLFIEKEGFEPLLRAAQIAERFDIAIMSTKGMSVIAARALVDRLSAQGVTILVAHDLDMAGIRIFGTLGTSSNRYQFTHRPDIRRLGLTFEQAVRMDLQSETQELRGDARRILAGLSRHGASQQEIEFLGSGERVELNAMPSDQFIAWIEEGLRAHGVQKVVPSADLIEQRAREIVGLQYLARDVEELEAAARRHAASVELPKDLAERIRQEFAADPTLPWEDALRRALERREG